MMVHSLIDLRIMYVVSPIFQTLFWALVIKQKRKKGKKENSKLLYCWILVGRNRL